MTENKYDVIYKELAVEMFQRVGLNLSYEEIKEYAKQPNWYWLKTWTKQEEDSFIQWVVAKLRKELHYSKKAAEKQANWFVSDIGWRVETNVS